MAINFDKYVKDVTRRNVGYDCSVRVNGSGMNTNGERRMAVVFRFYDGADKKFSNGTDYVLFGVDDERNRVYFKGSDPMSGYKLTSTNVKYDEGSKMITRTIPNLEVDLWRSRVGDYNILYDRDEKMYYIDLERKA